MIYYHVTYELGGNNEHIYPSDIEEVVWDLVQYHFSDKSMIGRTDRKIKTDPPLQQLPENQAKRMILDFKKSYL